MYITNPTAGVSENKDMPGWKSTETPASSRPVPVALETPGLPILSTPALTPELVMSAPPKRPQIPADASDTPATPHAEGRTTGVAKFEARRGVAGGDLAARLPEGGSGTQEGVAGCGVAPAETLLHSRGRDGRGLAPADTVSGGDSPAISSAQRRLPGGGAVAEVVEGGGGETCRICLPDEAQPGATEMVSQACSCQIRVSCRCTSAQRQNFYACCIAETLSVLHFNYAVIPCLKCFGWLSLAYCRT